MQATQDTLLWQRKLQQLSSGCQIMSLLLTIPTSFYSAKVVLSTSFKIGYFINANLYRRLHELERLRADMERAWAIYLPSVDLQDALQTVRSQHDSITAIQQGPQRQKHLSEVTHATEQPPASFAEPSNAEDYEFDESQDFDNSTDGMGFLTVDPHKAGYTGPQSGIAALKFLQSLPLYLPLTSFSPLSCLDDDMDGGTNCTAQQRRADVLRYLDDYFAIYHPAYPILHEGTFRARVSGSSSSQQSISECLTTSRCPSKATRWFLAHLVQYRTRHWCFRRRFARHQSGYTIFQRSTQAFVHGCP